jgi:hypothetical protein
VGRHDTHPDTHPDPGTGLNRNDLDTLERKRQVTPFLFLSHYKQKEHDNPQNQFGFMSSFSLMSQFLQNISPAT